MAEKFGCGYGRGGVTFQGEFSECIRGEGMIGRQGQSSS